VTEQIGLAELNALVQRQQTQIAQLQHSLGILEDKDEIQRLQYAYGFFLDNRMFREIADLFASEGAWIEIGGRGRYKGKERIHRFLLEVLGGGRWGLAKNEVINHVQQQLFITVANDRQSARARARAEVQGNSPPDSPTFLFADGIYENEYIREGGQWRILSIRVTMTYYAALERRSLTFPTAPPSTTFPPDLPSQQALAPGLGRQFNEFHFRHPITGEALRTPVSDPNAE
jgi:SnoaL-like domain